MNFKVYVIYVYFSLIIIKLVSSKGELRNLMFYILHDVLIIIIVYDAILILIIILFIIVFINYVVLKISPQCQSIAWLIIQLYQKCKNRIIIGNIFIIAIHALVIIFVNLYDTLIIAILTSFVLNLTIVVFFMEITLLYYDLDFASVMVVSSEYLILDAVIQEQLREDVDSCNFCKVLYVGSQGELKNLVSCITRQGILIIIIVYCIIIIFVELMLENEIRVKKNVIIVITTVEKK